MIDYGYGVTLGPLNSEHKDTIRSWRNDARVWKWCRQFKPISDLEQGRWLENQSKDPSVQMYSVLFDNQIQGVCGFTSIDLINRRAEFSLYINPDMGKKGLGERALKTLLAHGFKNWGFNCIWGETFQGNHALKLFERVGMKVEGERRKFYFRDGKFINCTLVSILASEWAA